MANLIILNVKHRNGIDFSPSREYVIDLDDLESIIREDASGDCYFTVREIKGVSTQNGNYAKVNYVVDENIAAIDALSEGVFALTVLQRNADVDSFPESILFYEKKFMGYVREIADTTSPFFGKSEFYYAESGDPDGVYYVVDEALAYFITASTPYVLPKIENTAFVDSIYGTDATGLVERMDRPFRTIAAAITAVSSGQMVFVRPGDHVVATNIFKNGVKVWLEPNANVTFNGATTKVDFPASINQSFSILGHGSINFTAGTFVNAPITSDGSVFTMEADSVIVNTATGTFGTMASGKFILRASLMTVTKAFEWLYFTEIAESDVYIKKMTCVSSELNIAPYTIDTLTATAVKRSHRLTIEDLVVNNNDIGFAWLLDTSDNYKIDINIIKGSYTPITPSAGVFLGSFGGAYVTLNESERGYISSLGAGIYIGDGGGGDQGLFVTNAFLQCLEKGTLIPVLSVSGTNMKVVNNGILKSENDDYQITIGVVNDGGTFNQVADFGVLENHGQIVSMSLIAAIPIILKEGAAPSDSMLILGAETVIYSVTPTQEAVSATAAQDIKCYGYPVTNGVINAFITNIIPGTNIISDSNVETAYSN